MKICVSIDSEEYTILNVEKVVSDDEAVTKLLTNYDCSGLSLEIEKQDDSTRITLSNAHYFIVAQVFDMPANQFATIWWHAYDGVDFKIENSHTSLDDAIKALNTYVNEQWIADEHYDVEYYDEGDSSATANNRNDCEMLKIIDLKEVA
ncbi:hypothetical protein [Butyrivibrio hungatei]|uniref:Uncharacterized protein n=1 Tax=Butyrivibrio hungatei TaxID=185008 RepID=A0A1D9P5U6_9FIRM|nr:hypothetical protein [Butyrivibrio hungatei]AOZ97940.1 hypothetical protein bhn_II141 [Butyrivibrio hungatei]